MKFHSEKKMYVLETLIIVYCIHLEFQCCVPCLFLSHSRQALICHPLLQVDTWQMLYKIL